MKKEEPSVNSQAQLRGYGKEGRVGSAGHTSLSPVADQWYQTQLLFTFTEVDTKGIKYDRLNYRNWSQVYQGIFSAGMCGISVGKLRV